jgi:hypothetical protein
MQPSATDRFRYQRQGRRNHRWRNRLSSLLVLLGLVAAIAFLPSFHLAKYEISPTRAMTTAEIEAAIPIKPGQHLFVGLGPDLRRLFSLRYDSVEKALKTQFPYIRSIQASLSFPSTMVIEIEERVEVAYVAIPDGCVMLDKEGYALRILDQSPADIPVIEGVTVTSLTLGQILTVNAPEAMNSAVSLLGAIIDADKDTRTSQKLLSQVRKIRPLSDGRLFMTLALPATGEELTVAAQNSTDQLDDMLWLRFAMDQGALDRGKGVLDLTGSRKVFIPDA